MRSIPRELWQRSNQEIQKHLKRSNIFVCDLNDNRYWNKKKRQEMCLVEKCDGGKRELEKEAPSRGNRICKTLS